jgi:hypothetical protein
LNALGVDVFVFVAVGAIVPVTLATLRQILVFRSRLVGGLVWMTGSTALGRGSVFCSELGSLLGRFLASFLLSRQRLFGLHVYAVPLRYVPTPKFPLLAWSSIVNSGIAVIVSQTALDRETVQLRQSKRRLWQTATQALEVNCLLVPADMALNF